jgi:hypothetical protein
MTEGASITLCFSRSRRARPSETGVGAMKRRPPFGNLLLGRVENQTHFTRRTAMNHLYLGIYVSKKFSKVFGLTREGEIKPNLWNVRTSDIAFGRKFPGELRTPHVCVDQFFF